MTSKELLELYQQTVINFHSEMKAPANDCALNILLQMHKDVIIKEDWMSDDPVGTRFHKSFRNNILKCEQTSQAVWFLMQDAPLLWMVIKEKRVLTPDPNKTRNDYIDEARRKD